MQALHKTIRHIQDLKRRTDLHISRKIWHCLGVLLVALVYAHLSKDQAMIAISVLWLTFVPADFLRQKNAAFNEWILEKFGLLFRQHEADGLAGTTYLVTGTWILVALYPRNIALLALLFLALADPLASLVGIRFGKTKILGAKSLEGTLASFAICVLIAAFYFPQVHMFENQMVLATLSAGVIGALSELIPVFGLDDNLTFPLMSATFLVLLEKLL